MMKYFSPTNKKGLKINVIEDSFRFIYDEIEYGQIENIDVGKVTKFLIEELTKSGKLEKQNLLVRFKPEKKKVIMVSDDHLG